MCAQEVRDKLLAHVNGLLEHELMGPLTCLVSLRPAISSCQRIIAEASLSASLADLQFMGVGCSGQFASPLSASGRLDCEQWCVSG